VTGGAVHSRQSAFSMETMTVDQLGRAAQVRVTKDHTAIIGGATAVQVEFRITQLRAERERATYGRDQDVLTQRIGTLAGQVAVIKVGAPTPAERKELDHRVEDALSATRAAMAEGIVAGGGVALLRAAAALGDLAVSDDDYATGVEIVRRTLPLPAYLIAAIRYSWRPLRQHVRVGCRRPVTGGPFGAAKRCFGGRLAAHHRYAGRGGTNTLGRQPGFDDRVRSSRRRYPPTVSGRRRAAVARLGPGHQLTRQPRPGQGRE